MKQVAKKTVEKAHIDLTHYAALSGDELKLIEDEANKIVKEGRFHEEDAFDDYFKFDNLEAERDRILNHLEKL